MHVPPRHLPGGAPEPEPESALPTLPLPPCQGSTRDTRGHTGRVLEVEHRARRLGWLATQNIGSGSTNGSTAGRCLRAANTLVLPTPLWLRRQAELFAVVPARDRGREKKRRGAGQIRARIVAGLRGGRDGTSLSRICLESHTKVRPPIGFLRPELTTACRQPRAPGGAWRCTNRS